MMKLIRKLKKWIISIPEKVALTTVVLKELEQKLLVIYQNQDTILL